MTFEGDAVALEDFAMDEVERRVGNKNAGREIWTEEVVAIRRGAVGGAGGVAFADVVEALLRFASGEKIVVLGCDDAEVGDFQGWIAFHVAARQIIMPEPIRIVVAEPIVPIVPAAAKLGGAFDRFNFTGVWTKTKIAAKTDRAPGEFGVGEQCFLNCEIAPAFAIGAVKPAVHAEFEAVETVLLVAGREPRDKNLA